MKAIVKHYVGSETVTLKAFHDEWEVLEHRDEVQNLADSINYLQERVAIVERQRDKVQDDYEKAMDRVGQLESALSPFANEGEFVPEDASDMHLSYEMLGADVFEVTGFTAKDIHTASRVLRKTYD